MNSFIINREISYIFTLGASYLTIQDNKKTFNLLILFDNKQPFSEQNCVTISFRKLLFFVQKIYVF